MIQYHRLSPITIDLRRGRGGSPLLETLIRSYVFFASSGSLPPDHHPRTTTRGPPPADHRPRILPSVQPLRRGAAPKEGRHSR
jgi:hypothetical protein